MMTAPDAVVLRPYQGECVVAPRGAYAAGRGAPLLQLATCGGKTIIFAEVMRGARAKMGTAQKRGAQPLHSLAALGRRHSGARQAG